MAQQVLVIEDNPGIRRLIAIYCGELGFSVHQARSGRRAMEILDSVTPDLVCLDLVLPELCGLALCERIRRNPRLAHVPVMVISGRSLPMDRADAEEAGVTEYVIKPFTGKQFAQAVRRALPHWHQSGENRPLARRG